MAAGDPMDWDLQTQVALIPRETWEAGADAVSQAISDIEATFLKDRDHQIEEIAQDPEDGLYNVTTTTEDVDGLLPNLTARLERYLGRALGAGNQSGFSDLCAAYQILRDVVDFGGDDPNGALTDLGIARKTIVAALVQRAYLPEPNLDALIMLLERAETQLRADHPEVRAANDRFVAQKLREMDDDKRLAIAAGMRDVGEGATKGRLAADFSNGALVLETQSGVEAQADVVKRAGGRAGKMAVDLSQKAKAVDGSGAFKATGIALRVQKLVELIWPLL